jgi:hypothetical protein
VTAPPDDSARASLLYSLIADAERLAQEINRGLSAPQEASRVALLLAVTRDIAGDLVEAALRKPPGREGRSPHV